MAPVAAAASEGPNSAGTSNDAVATRAVVASDLDAVVRSNTSATVVRSNCSRFWYWSSYEASYCCSCCSQRCFIDQWPVGGSTDASMTPSSENGVHAKPLVRPSSSRIAPLKIDDDKNVTEDNTHVSMRIFYSISKVICVSLPLHPFAMFFPFLSVSVTGSFSVC